MQPADKPRLRKIGIWLAITGLLILVITFFVASRDADCFMRVDNDCVIPNNDLYGLIIGMFVLTWGVVFLAAQGIVTALRDHQASLRRPE